MPIEQIHINVLMERSGVGFGTSGARGLVVDMTPPICYAYTRAFLQHLEQTCNLLAGCEVLIAGDLRPSTPKIMAAVAAAVVDAGYCPVNCGFLPSPAVVYEGMRRVAPSIMVTGSHIPDDRNGIKFNTPYGEILKDDESGIRAQRVGLPESIRTDALPAIDPRARVSYVGRYMNFFPHDILKGMRIAVYEHSSVARDLLGEILEGLGAHVIRLGRTSCFTPVDTEAIRSEDIDLAKRWANEHRFDAIVSTDGDADRPLIGTDAGEWLRGDIVGVLCAKALGIRVLATPVSSNTVVESCGWFEKVARTRIGSPYVIAAMQTLRAEGYTSIAGYEANGGFLLASNLVRNGYSLAELPTRDAFLPIFSLLAECHTRKMTMNDLVGTLPPRATASGRLKHYPTERSLTLIERLNADNIPAVEALFGDLCGNVASMDIVDGLRIRFINGEIIHLRPSGNAPEFRCYNEASSEERAIELNLACLERLKALKAES